jgi:hypothetical protein
MPHTRANAMKFSRQCNWIGNNAISISLSTHVRDTVCNFSSSPLVQELEGGGGGGGKYKRNSAYSFCQLRLRNYLYATKLVPGYRTEM